MALRIAPHLAWQMIDGEGIVIDLEGRKVIGFNATGSLIWSMLPDKDEEAIASSVAENFEVDAESARRDVGSFLSMLKTRGLVVEA